jgi:hypothetical protein
MQQQSHNGQNTRSRSLHAFHLKKAMKPTIPLQGEYLFKQSCLQLLGIGATPLILTIYYGTYTSSIFGQWQREEYMGIIFLSPLSERYHPAHSTEANFMRAGPT